MADLLDLRAYREARHLGATVPYACEMARLAGALASPMADARRDLDAAGELPASWLKDSPRPEPCLTTTPGSPTVA